MAQSGSNVTTALAVAVFALLVDQASKYAITDIMGLGVGQARTIIPGFLTFIMSKNTGINFGLFASGSPVAKLVLAGLAVAVSIALLVWAARRWRDGIFAFGVGLIVGGAIGNAIDRLVYGAVTDFLNVTCCGINNPFAFNIADVWIFAGVAILLFRTAGDDKRTA